MSKYKLICADIHGTIMPYNSLEWSKNAESYFNEEYTQFINKLKAKNIALALVSGGTTLEILGALETLKFTDHFNVHLVSGQCDLLSCDSGKTWLTIPLGNSQTACLQKQDALFTDILHCGHKLDIVYSKSKLNHSHNPFHVPYKIGRSVRLVTGASLLGLPDFKTVTQDLVDYVNEKWKLQTYVLGQTKSSEHMINLLEFNESNFNKHSAIQFLRKKLGIAKEQVLFYGNGENDLEAFLNYDSILSCTTDLFRDSVNSKITNAKQLLEVAKQPFYKPLLKYL